MFITLTPIRTTPVGLTLRLNQLTRTEATEKTAVKGGRREVDMATKDDPYEIAAWKIINALNVFEIKSLLRNDNALKEYIKSELLEQDYTGMFVELVLDLTPPTQFPVVVDSAVEAYATTLSKLVDLERLRKTIIEIYS